MQGVYLAGPITGLNYGESMEWREQAIRNLDDCFLVYSPMRNKRHLAENFDTEALPHSHPTFRDPYERDRHDIMRSDYVIINLTQGVNSIGTAVEIGIASALDKYIIVIYPGDLDDLHPFWKGPANEIVYTLEEACERLYEYLPVGGC